MDTNKTAFWLKTLHRAMDIPIVYGKYGEQLMYFQPFSMLTENDTEFISGRLDHIIKKFPDAHAMYLLHTSMVMLGIIINHATSEFVFIGPLASASSTDKSINDYLFEAGLSPETTKKLTRYLNTYRRMTVDNLKNLLVSINTVVNDETLSTKELTAIFDDETANKIQFAEKEFTLNAERQDKQDVISIEEYDHKLNYCIMNGDLDGLADLLNYIGEMQFPQNSATSVNEVKISTFGSVFAAETIALKSGIPKADLEHTKQFYLHRIDNSTDVIALRKLSISALFDFTKAVKDYLTHKTDNPTISRAINFIKSNINTKLTADIIAQSLHINPHYLFVKFKSETGMTLTQFITKEKIKKACYYLVFTNKSLVDIAVYLSFSSQSYFQTVFKQEMGVTPNEYRIKNTYITQS